MSQKYTVAFLIVFSGNQVNERLRQLAIVVRKTLRHIGANEHSLNQTTFLLG